MLNTNQKAYSSFPQFLNYLHFLVFNFSFSQVKKKLHLCKFHRVWNCAEALSSTSVFCWSRETKRSTTGYCLY